jgi:hypothetical protein
MDKRQQIPVHGGNALYVWSESTTVVQKTHA